jgi:hypothetical protein
MTSPHPSEPHRLANGQKCDPDEAKDKTAGFRLWQMRNNAAIYTEEVSN